MSNKRFVLLWSKILDSSIWMEDGPTRLVWITMIAMKDVDGVVTASVVALAHRARVTPEECRKALGIFLKPDPDDSSKVEAGVRIREVPGGWAIINHELYRYSSDERREYWRNKKAEQRQKAGKKKWPKKKPPLKGEVAYLKGVENGTVDQDGVPIPPREREREMEQEHPEDE